MNHYPKRTLEGKRNLVARFLVLSASAWVPLFIYLFDGVLCCFLLLALLTQDPCAPIHLCLAVGLNCAGTLHVCHLIYLLCFSLQLLDFLTVYCAVFSSSCITYPGSLCTNPFMFGCWIKLCGNIACL